MATDRAAVLSVPVAAALLLWPALRNGYPIVFADTGTYLSQAIHRYAGWDRPVFYSLFMVPLHATVTTWPVVAVQALLAAWVLRLACRVLAPGLPEAIYLAAMAALSVGTWLPWLVCALMPDVFTPLLVLVLCMLALVPERIKHRERTALAGLATIMIASQLSSLPLACALAGALLVIRTAAGPRQRPHGRPSGPRDAPPPRPDVTTDSWMASERVASAWMAGTRPATTIERRPCCTLSPALTATGSSSTMTAVAPSAAPAPATRRIRAWRLVMLPPALAVLGLCAVNLAAHGRFAIAPFGDVFLLARVLYDGPGMTVLQRDCPASGWRLCPLLDRFPPTSDDFLWMPDSPLYLAGGPKAVAQEARAIIAAAVAADAGGIARAALANTLEQLSSFASGDGLQAWPDQVTPWIERDFPQTERSAYASALQQRGLLTVSPVLARMHRITALAGIAACILLLPVAMRRRAACLGFLLAALIVLPVSAVITGWLSGPHDRYQARIMWLPPLIATVSVLSLRRPS